ncbi:MULTISPECIES: hypothetical protein [unclassified Pseudofrankia]|uniref:hypothetical protein n=1 Tax=unclassified Pseudofrankia TaxID=2994372 RepID=UPI0008D903BC|nr:MULTISPECIES: hypothetical protein [unclassified Pseudofrankia]MDT3439095.1 hypothetical protein [Pseudofrankia sp. BMG5.37]OHV45769.1 hypothetical protein BCD48_21620 [Pseudofrankia sp. BMG5.36]
MSTDETETTPGSRPSPVAATGSRSKPMATTGSRPGLVTPMGSQRWFGAPRYLVLCLLGVAMLGSLGGWIAMVLMDKEVPDGFPVVIGTVIGGLVGIAATDRSS